MPTALLAQFQTRLVCRAPAGRWGKAIGAVAPRQGVTKHLRFNSTSPIKLC